MSMGHSISMKHYINMQHYSISALYKYAWMFGDYFY